MGTAESHLDDDALVLAVLGGAGGEPDAELSSHLAGCEACRTRAHRLQRVVTAARVDAPGELVAPPPGAWAAIAAAAGASPAPVLERGAETRPLAPERGRGRARLVAALAAAAGVGVILGAGASWLAGSGDTAGGTDGGREVAGAALTPLAVGDTAASGTASLLERDGGRELAVSVTGLTAGAAGYREVWLLDPDGGGLVSLGVLEGAQGRFTVPRSVDLTRFAVVDISAEPADGDPTHSADSLLRGGLTAQA